MSQEDSSFTKKVFINKCPYCSRQIRATSKFCSFCGKSTNKEPVKTKQKIENPVIISNKNPETIKSMTITPFIGNENKEKNISPVNKEKLIIDKSSVENKLIQSLHNKSSGSNVSPAPKCEVKNIPVKTEHKKSINSIKTEKSGGDKFITCPYCQEKIDLLQKICDKCHRSLKYCSVCNILNRGIARFCRSCKGVFPPDKCNWSTFRGNNSRTGFVEEKLEFPFYFQWMYPGLDDNIGPLWASPVVYRDRLFVASREKQLYTFNQFTGKLLWSQPTSASVVCTPAVDEKFVYVGCEDGKIFAIDNEKGGVAWFYDTEKEIGGSLLINDDRVYIPLKEGRILVLNSGKNGAMSWCFPHRKASAISEIVASPSIYEDVIVFPSTNKTIYALSCKNAAILWKFQTKSPVISSCAINNGIVYIIDRGGKMAALDIKTGQDMWAGLIELPGPFSASPGVNNELVIVASQRGVVYALDCRTGGIKWEITVNLPNYFESINSSPVITKDKVIVCTDGGYLYMMDLQDGRNLWQFQGNSWIWASPAVSQGYVYITSNDGHVYAFSNKKPEK